jgi:hypothetical protein
MACGHRGDNPLVGPLRGRDSERAVLGVLGSSPEGAAAGLVTRAEGNPFYIVTLLLYRVITFKLVVTLLWLGYRYLQDHAHRAAT